MIVCICANVSEKKIKAMMPRAIDEVMIETGAAMQCGRCSEQLKRIVQEFGGSVWVPDVLCKHVD